MHVSIVKQNNVSTDGRIIPMFEERLRQLGSLLDVNGEAIYSSIPWSHQNDTLTDKVWYVSNISWCHHLVNNVAMHIYTRDYI
jgi:alpha-L-fucosidase